MEPTKKTKLIKVISQALTLTAALGLLTACGGGGGDGFDPATTGGTAAPNDGLPGFTPPAGTPVGDPVSNPADDPVDGPVVVPGTQPIQPPAPPVPQPVYAAGGDVHAVAVADDGALYFVSAAGQLMHKAAADADASEIAGVPPTHMDVRGMAVGPANRLYLLSNVASGDDELLVYDLAGPDPTTPAVVGAVTGYTAIESLIWHADAAEYLLAVDTDTKELIQIAMLDASPTVVGSLGDGVAGDVRGLAADRATGRVWGAENGVTDYAVEVDVDTGAATRLIRLAARATSGLAFDPVGNWFYAASEADNRVERVNSFGNGLEMVGMFGLAHDPATGNYYGSHVLSAQLVEINHDANMTHVIGYTGVAMLEGLAYDSVGQALYGVSSANSSLYALNKDDGTAALRGVVANGANTWNTLQGLAVRQGMLYAVDNATSDILAINPLNAAPILLGTAPAFAGMHGLAYDADLDRLVSFDDGARTWVMIDISNASNAQPGEVTAFSGMSGLAWADGAPRLFGTELATSQLVEIYNRAPPSMAHDTVAAAAFDGGGMLYGFDNATESFLQLDELVQGSASFAVLSGADIQGMVYDASTGLLGQLIGVDASGERILTLDIDSNAPGQIGLGQTLAGMDIRGLALDVSNGVLYGVDLVSGELVTISMADGTATAVAAGTPVGYGNIESLTFDSVQGVLLGVDRINKKLISIDLATGVGSEIGSVALEDIRSLSFDPILNELIAIDMDTDRIVRLDPMNGAAL